ncbi:RhuM family protein [Rickettsia australis]|uniref:Virulence protein n=1 Tax=Rickettsia australis (strain Cutlack) TaxID=1105110 RepID=H8K6E2_RICAC|nr:RhuM family protein [Rickettsia australis]AFC70835.1 virulence protein [Rickettsia australis str. Cutlack]
MAYAYKKRLGKATVACVATVQIEGEKSVERQIEYYNLDAIILVRYRVNSKREIAFRKWATNLLKEYSIIYIAFTKDCTVNWTMI